MPRFWKLFAIALLAFFAIVPAASAQRGGFGGHGGFGEHGGFGWRGGGHYGGGGFYGGGWGWGGYGPGWGWYGPGWGWGWDYPYYGGGYPYAEGPSHPYGEVKITGVGKDAMVYVDGGYAGRVGDLKKFRLSAGNHEIELRDPSGQAFHQEKINVLPGKTLEIHGTAGGH